ncbi:PRDM4 [Mytilus coruscus]|uniref:PRDM4 n=1 Tax=Mytilus coruscus TaxID=42192 RepID=A0A6J8ARF2_MYTCO|nr:PRDM4 [Mytilus coruscus]
MNQLQYSNRKKQPAQPGSILIKSTSGENVTVNYQHIQSVLSSLISSLQGQLDATRKLYSPIMSTSVQNSTSHAQIGSGLNQQILDITGSNQLPDIPYSFVPLPINPIQADQQNDNPVDQNILSCNSAVEIAQNLACESRTCQQKTPNQTIRNSIDVDSNLINESNMTGGNQIEHVGDRLVDESFLSEQSEALYEEQHFLYNKSIDFLNSRGDSSSVTINNIEEGLVNHDTMHLTDDSGCQDITESNTLKAQMLLTQDPEEDFTDVPNMFKQYCLSCKAAMLNEDCQFHKIGYNHIKDTPILSKARTSIPSCLTLQPTSTFGYNVYLGVWTKESIPAHTKFGPLAGKIESECERNSETVQCFPAWKIFLETRSEMIDVSDENECNWMMFLKPARCEKTQNLIAHQLGRHIYFFTTKEVFCGQELLYWFSKEYATLSGYPCLPGEASLSECPICGKVFIDKSTRKLHMKEHPHYQKFKCHICDHLYSSLSSLKRHTMLHMGVKPHICHVCHKTFNDSSNLKVHLKVHTGMKVFTCNICQKTFRQKAHLKTHLLIHTGQKNLKCYFCDKTFAREGDRKQHEYQHTKEKTFKCEECGKVFYKLQNYKRHLLIHTGVRDFECQFCMKTFGRKFHLQRHMEKCQARNEIFEEKDLILNNVDLKGILNS